MLFNSLAYLIFLPVVLVAYYCLSRRAQNIWLLAASYIFYGWWDWRFLSLIIASTLIDFFCAQMMTGDRRQKSRHIFLIVSVISNLSFLGTFKYFNFFSSAAADLLMTLGFQPHIPTLNIILPVGISFYTFQSMSYTIDVYRRKIQPTYDLLDFALYVAFFPQLVAGPIERASHLLPQIQKARRVTWPQIAVGLELIIIGYFKKVGVADTLAPIVDSRFSQPSQASGADLLLCAYLFSLQIYCDFSGYSDIARGTSRLFGVDLMRNFNQPYLSSSIVEFWRRWHISLSTWLRDYLYVPLGGNRHGTFKTNRNLMLTMLLGGLWHGANWTFLIWGGMHGTYLIINKWLSEHWHGPSSARSAFVVRIASALFVFHLVTLTWVFFRADDLGTALTYLAGIAAWQPPGGITPEIAWLSPRNLTLIGTLVLIDLWQARRGDHAVAVRWAWPLRSLAYVWLIIVTLSLGNLDGEVPFIYFQF